MPGRLGVKGTLAGISALVLLLLALTWHVVPHTAFYERNLPWIIARSAGLAALVLLAVLVVLGSLMSHPINRAFWKQTKPMLVWHRYLSTFVFAFVIVHVVAIVLDRYAHVSIIGALVPGQAGYRAAAVALGTVSLYAMALTGLTASYAQKLPPKLWLYIHRGAMLVFALAWTHGMLAGSDSIALRSMYFGLAGVVMAAGGTRYWLEMPRRRKAEPVGGKRV